MAKMWSDQFPRRRAGQRNPAESGKDVRPVFRSKNEIVLNTLRERILHGELKPGQKLVIDDLAEQLGTSAIPIREALRQLQADGLVVIEPYVGASVTAIHPGLVREIFSVLEALETISSRAACPRLTDEDLARLRHDVVEMDASVAEPDRWSLENRRLHLFICERAGMVLVADMMSRAFDHWDRLRRHYLNDVFAHRIAQAQREHHAILDAFGRRDANEVERQIHLHNQAALTAYMNELQTEGANAPGEER